MIFRQKKNLPDHKKKFILQKVLQNIIIDYDHENKVHLITIYFKIPIVFDGNNASDRLSDVAEINVVPPLGRKSTHPLSNYSTVTDLARFRGWSTLVPRITAI